MKKAIIPITLVAALAIATIIPGCAAAGPGNIVTEERDFIDFSYIEVEGTFEIKITQSDSFSVIVSADNSFFDYIAVSKEGETLRIYLNPRHTFTDFNLQARTLKAEITMPALYGLQLSGASTGTVSGFKSSAGFSLDISGASSVDIEDIEANDVEFKVSGASKIRGNIKTTDATIEISGASEVELAGSAHNIFLSASGASKADLDALPLNDVEARLSGASEASLHPKGKLDSSLSAASKLYFQGNPTMGDISVSGASTIKHK